MDRAQSELLVKTNDYIQGNISVGEFIDRIEPRIGGDAARRLRLLFDGDSLASEMPQ